MSAIEKDDDPVWVRIKAQTKPLKKARRRSLEDVLALQKKPDPSRPIRESKATTRPSQPVRPTEPTREDRHKRVRRGRIEIDRTIDLHGLTEAQAQAELTRFLTRIVAARTQTVLVITGKGERGNGVLRKALPGWLHSAPLAPLVSGFAQAHFRHGGGGAWYLFLRKKPVTG